MPSQGVTNVANAIINKINNLISSHNNNSNAHQDIRESIPSATSELNNNSGFITSSSIPSASNTTPSADTTSGSVGTGTTWARNDHTHPKSSLYAESTHTHSDANITTLGFYGNLPQANYESPSQQQVNFAINSAMGGKEDNANKVTSLSSSSTDTQYPSAKAVYDAINNDNGSITSSQIINNDNFCDYKTLVPLVDEGENISDVSFEDYDFDIMFTINPNIEENSCAGSIEIGDPVSSGLYILYSPNYGIEIHTEGGGEFNMALNMDSENIVKIKQDQSTNDLTFTVNNHELIITNNSEIPKNIMGIVPSAGTISNFGVKTCTRIITEATINAPTNKNFITTSFTPSKLIRDIDLIENDGIVNNHNSFTVTEIDYLEFDFGCQNNEYYEFDITTSKGHLNIYGPKRGKKYCELYRDTTYTIKITHDELLIVKGTTVDGTTVVDLSNSNGILLFDAAAVCQFDFSNKKWYHEATFFDKIYPIGSVHITTNSVNPSNYFDGEWERIQDTFLLASGATYENGATGGSATVTLTASQSGVPAHSHKYQDYNTTYTLKTTNRKPGTSTAVAYGTSLTAGGGATERTSSNNTAANASQAHNNMPPYLAVYMWERVG